ncbi:hypothetical protein CN507_17820 [Bacillus cereus]|nr:hypothetical protein CN507_17820 [Bacillus cereus]
MMETPSNLASDLHKACMHLFQRFDKGDPVRVISLSVSKFCEDTSEQLSIFEDPFQRERQKNLVNAMDEIRSRYGKNSILRAVSYTENATMRRRNTQVGGHHA